MYKRVSVADVEDRAGRIRRSTGKNYQINWSGIPVRPRMHLRLEGDYSMGEARNISPRLSRREWMIWSDGFLEGLYGKGGGHDKSN